MAKKLAFDETDYELINHFVKSMVKFATFVYIPGKTDDVVMRIENAYCKALVRFTEENEILLAKLTEAP
jgi:hypothetical protein